MGPLAQLDQYTFTHPALPRDTDGKLFLHELLGLTSTEISLDKMPPKTSMLFYHRHMLNEESYVFLRGTGEFQIDDKVLPIGEGTIVRVAPEGERCWRNTSTTEDLLYIVIQARAGTYQGQTIDDGIAVQKKVSWVGKAPA